MEYKEIFVDDIKFFIRRRREKSAYQRLKENISRIGIKVPIGVKDISHKSRKERIKPDGTGFYRYQLIKGQGRLQAAKELELTKVPAIVHDVKDESEGISQFLIENLIRTNLTAYERAKLIEYDIDEGKDPQEIAQKYGIKLSTVKRYYTILKKSSPQVLAQLQDEKIPLAVANYIVHLNKDEQDLIVETYIEEKISKKSLPHLLKKLQEIKKEKKKLTKTDLKENLRKVQSNLEIERKKLIHYNRLWAMSIGHFQDLLEDTLFKNALDRFGIDYSSWEK